jgi:hypothetical protein
MAGERFLLSLLCPRWRLGGSHGSICGRRNADAATIGCLSSALDFCNRRLSITFSHPLITLRAAFELVIFGRDFLDLYRTLVPQGYNIRTGGVRGLHCEESRKRMCLAKLGEKNPNFGKPRHTSRTYFKTVTFPSIFTTPSFLTSSVSFANEKWTETRAW